MGVRALTENHEMEPVTVKHLETHLELTRKKSKLKICRKIGKESSIFVLLGISLSFSHKGLKPKVELKRKVFFFATNTEILFIGVNLQLKFLRSFLSHSEKSKLLTVSCVVPRNLVTAYLS